MPISVDIRHPKFNSLNFVNESSVFLNRINISNEISKALDKNCATKDEEFLSLISFYDSIPDYRDIHHLSEYEFQNQLLMLKQKHCEIFLHETDCIDFDIHCNSIQVSNCKNADLDIEFTGLINENEAINSTIKHCLGYVEGSSAKTNDDEFDSISNKGFKSKSASPSMLNIPQRYQRETEYISNKLMDKHKSSKADKEINCKAKFRLSHSIPLTAGKQHKSELSKLNSNIELQSQMKPFYFNKISPRHFKRSHTSPQLTTPTNNSKNYDPRGRASPINLFSNYFIHNMEEKYFRALNRKVRSEGMLKISSLPPLMKKRTKGSLNLEKINSSSSVKQGKRRRKATRKLSNCYKKEEFIATCLNPFRFETEKRSTARNSKSPSYCVSNTSSKSSSTYLRPIPIYPLARPNLAANLRVEWARKKLSEMSMAEKNLTKENCRPSNWGIRKSTAWKSLFYDHTNDKDISLRLATRRAEEKLHQEEHQLKMEIMRRRVQATPLLLEGPPHWEPRTVAHDCLYGNLLIDEKLKCRCGPSINCRKFAQNVEKKFETASKSGEQKSGFGTAVQ